MINKIGIDNFRVFKGKTDFELTKFTILTGPNNSGKSSFIKLLLLLKEGVEKLDFEQGHLHNLESFDKVLNWNNKDSKEISISFGFDDRPYTIELIYSQGKLTCLKCHLCKE